MTSPPRSPPEGATLFLSDVHLGAGGPADDAARAARLLAFLDRHGRKARRLFVLGDLFDFWFDYRHAIPKAHLRVAARLGALVDAGVEVTFFGGNHDFWAGPFLAETFGLTSYDQPATLTIDGRGVALMHGDGLARGDSGYKALKGLLRNRWTIGAYRALHPDLGIPFALWVSRVSRHSRDESAVDREWLYRQLALPRYAEGADAAITGHYHHPTHFRREGRDFLVLGDWVMHSTFASLADGRFALWAWDGATARPWDGPGVDTEARP
ncbi:MAG: UDP-2,3-diacylglucosamine diphosphatase [Candidatus Eisenbacteria bacterium]